jgi:pentatricopeptide repeat protein
MRALWLHSFVATLVLRIERVYPFTSSASCSRSRSARARARARARTVSSTKSPWTTVGGDGTRVYQYSNGTQNQNENGDPVNADDDSNNNARCVVPQNIPLDVLYEDPDMLVINKPAGMIMQFVAGSVESAVVFHLNSTASKTSNTLGTILRVEEVYYGSPSWPWKSQDSFEGIVHRLDKDTSGILVLAKHPLAATALHASFKERRCHKTYLAIAVGLPTKQTQTQTQQSALLQTPTAKSPQQNHLQPLLAVKPSLQRLSKAIKNCGRNATKALELLHQSSEPPNAVCFNAAISVCKRAGERDLALSTFDSMKKIRGLTPNTKCFMKAINLCAKEPPLYEKAIELVEFMDECGLPLNPHCVSSAISACGRAGQLQPALELLRLAEQQERSATVSDGMLGCFKAAISACERCGATDAAFALKDQLRTMNDMVELPREETSILRSVDEPQSLLNEAITVDAPIGKMGSRRRVMGILSKIQGGREARSIITPLAFDGALSLNSVVIETGRTHQIRVHMASILGCPLAGDQMYNSDDPFQRAERCMLHATELTVPHPTTGAMLRISCPPPPDFSALAETITGSPFLVPVR